MGLQIWDIIKLALPSLCIFYTLSWGRVPPARAYHESFGNHDTYLDVYFETNPEGFFQRRLTERKVRFSGFVNFGDEQEPVSGIRYQKDGEPIYLFHSRLGRFSGSLRPSKAHCEPSLFYSLREGERTIRSGVLQAGFCP